MSSSTPSATGGLRPLLVAALAAADTGPITLELLPPLGVTEITLWAAVPDALEIPWLVRYQITEG